MAKTPMKSATSVVTVRAFCRPMLRSAIMTSVFQPRGMKTVIRPTSASTTKMLLMTATICTLPRILRTVSHHRDEQQGSGQRQKARAEPLRHRQVADHQHDQRKDPAQESQDHGPAATTKKRQGGVTQDDRGQHEEQDTQQRYEDQCQQDAAGRIPFRQLAQDRLRPVSGWPARWA